MTTHTPGPWSLAAIERQQTTAFDTYAEGSDCSSLSGTVVAGNEVIARLPIEGKAGFSKVICHKNARLIAAAPDLFAALEIMTAFCRLKYGNLDKEVWAEICKAEAVIQKATGAAA